MAFADETLGDGVLDRLARVEQAHRVGDARAGAADLLGDLLLGQLELAHEASEGVGLLERVEVGALDVLHERQLQLLPVGRRAADDGRDAGQAGDPRGAQASLAGDEPVAVDRLLHDDRLEDAVGLDAAGQRLERFLFRVRSRLGRIQRDLLDRDLHRGWTGRTLRDERRETAAEPAGPSAEAGHAAPRCRRSRVRQGQLAIEGTSTVRPCRLRYSWATRR